jgi:hypothetical protein
MPVGRNGEQKFKIKDFYVQQTVQCHQKKGKNGSGNETGGDVTGIPEGDPRRGGQTKPKTPNEI